MAAIEKSTAPRAGRRRDKVQARLLAEQQKKTNQSEQMILQLQEALKKKDDELEALTAEELHSMDIDGLESKPEDSSEQNSKDNQSNQNTQGNQDTKDDGNGNEKAAEKKKKKKSNHGKTSKKKQNVHVRESIEESDSGEDDSDDESPFRSESDAESEGSETDDTDDEIDDNATAFSDKDYGKALYTFPGTQPVKDVETVGWSGGRSTGYINMYGKKSAARYRIERSAFPAQYEDDRPEKEKVSNPKNRNGDELLDNGKLRYTKRHIRGIFGVAWKSTGSRVSRHDLDCINPDLVDRWRDAQTYVLVAWDINGTISKTWETRGCLRQRWGKKDADIAIYAAAMEAEDRYQQAKTGKRPAKSRSPSIGLAQDHVKKHREKSLGVSRSSPLPATRSSKASKSSKQGTRDMEELRQEFLDNYLELSGADDFASLSRSQQRDCIAAWKEEKSLLDG